MKRILHIVLPLTILAVGLYAVREYTRTNTDLTGEKADFTVDASSLIVAFEKDSAGARKQYLNNTVFKWVVR